MAFHVFLGGFDGTFDCGVLQEFMRAGHSSSVGKPFLATRSPKRAVEADRVTTRTRSSSGRLVADHVEQHHFLEESSLKRGI